MTDPLEVDAPIAAVTVYPGQARMTAGVGPRCPPAARPVVVDGLPSTLVDDSVRVGGRGDFGPRRRHRHRPPPPSHGTGSHHRRLEAR